jgi:hypothetical protein
MNRIRPLLSVSWFPDAQGAQFIWINVLNLAPAVAHAIGLIFGWKYKYLLYNRIVLDLHISVYSTFIFQNISLAQTLSVRGRTSYHFDLSVNGPFWLKWIRIFRCFAGMRKLQFQVAIRNKKCCILHSYRVQYSYIGRNKSKSRGCLKSYWEAGIVVCLYTLLAQHLIFNNAQISRHERHIQFINGGPLRRGRQVVCGSWIHRTRRPG